MTAVLLFLLLAAFAAIWYLVPLVLRWLSSRKLRRYCKEQSAVVLSYDDGPSEHLLPRLLSVLNEEKVHATFFLLGRNVEERRNTVQLLVEAGHEVGGHTFHHSNAWKAWPLAAARDLSKGLKILQSEGVEAGVFRPPYGKATLATLADCRQRSVRLGWWTVDSQDVWDRRPISDVIDDLKAHGGGVVLMHDLDREELVEDGVSHSDYVLDLTREIVRFAANSGLRVKRLNDIYSYAAKR